MPFRPSRQRRGSDRFLDLKMILLALGGCTAIAGFMLRIDWLVTAAIFPLVIGVALSLRRRAGADAVSDDPADSGDVD
jgi:hypothetical protein